MLNNNLRLMLRRYFKFNKLSAFGLKIPAPGAIASTFYKFYFICLTD